jgi:hypothetical protein
MRPTYFVKHPDGTYSEVQPQPTDMWQDIVDFHAKFGIPCAPTPSLLGHNLGDDRDPQEMVDFRLKFLEEELQEFRDGVAAGDQAQCLDALVDLVYVAMGTARIMGMPWIPAWVAVQTANMQKVRAERAGDSKRGTSYDIVKPAGWIAPDIDAIIEDHRLNGVQVTSGQAAND